MNNQSGDNRMYEAEFPSVHQLVMVQVKRVADTSAYVHLLEYGRAEGMILFSEVSTRRIRSMLKEIRVGQFCVCLVLRVEPGKRYIDLSRKRVNQEERHRFLEKWVRSKIVDSTLKTLSSKFSTPVQELCEKISWPLYRKHKHAFEAFKQYVNDKDKTPFMELDISDEMRDMLLQVVERKLTPQATKLKAQVHVSCYEYAGVTAVKEALLAGRILTEDGKEDGVGAVQVKVIASPLYELWTQSFGKELGLKKLDQALNAVETVIKSHNGQFEIKKKPEVINGEDDEIVADDVDSHPEDDSEDDEEEEEEEEDQEGLGQQVFDFENIKEEDSKKSEAATAA